VDEDAEIISAAIAVAGGKRQEGHGWAMGDRGWVTKESLSWWETMWPRTGEQFKLFGVAWVDNSSFFFTMDRAF
jgi:hypothetical protein